MYSTVNNYALITHWLGVAQESETAKPVKELARENENSQVIDTTAQVTTTRDVIGYFFDRTKKVCAK